MKKNNIKNIRISKSILLKEVSVTSSELHGHKLWLGVLLGEGITWLVGVGVTLLVGLGDGFIVLVGLGDGFIVLVGLGDGFIV